MTERQTVAAPVSDRSDGYLSFIGFGTKDTSKNDEMYPSTNSWLRFHPQLTAMRSFISRAALLVNVSAKIGKASTP